MSEVFKSHICISVKVGLFRCPAGDRNSPPLNIFGKEVDLVRNSLHKQRIYHQKSINIQQSFHLGRTSRNTLSRRAHYKRLQKFAYLAIYKKEDFKRQDRRNSFSISLNFCQTILESSPQTRFMFSIKKLFIILIDALKFIPGETVQDMEN